VWKAKTSKDHRSEHSGQVFVAVREVVGQVQAIVFQHVEGFVLDLRAGQGRRRRSPLTFSAVIGKLVRKAPS
jgi:hypothetical protein